MEAFCVHCRAIRDMEAPRTKPLKSGKTVIEGHCTVCGAKVFAKEETVNTPSAPKQWSRP